MLIRKVVIKTILLTLNQHTLTNLKMKKHLWLIPAAALFAFTASAQETKKADKPADSTKKVTTPPTPPKPTVADKTKSSKKIDGLFTLYRDTVTGSLQLYVKKIN